MSTGSMFLSRVAAAVLAGGAIAITAASSGVAGTSGTPEHVRAANGADVFRIAHGGHRIYLGHLAHGEEFSVAHRGTLWCSGFAGGSVRHNGITHCSALAAGK